MPYFNALFYSQIMNRWLLSGFILIVLLLAALYLFIPSEIEVSKVVPVKCNVEAAARVLADTDRWNVWWPGGGPDRSQGVGEADRGQGGGGPERSPDGHPVWVYGQEKYAVSQRLWRSAAVEIDADGRGTPSVLALFPHAGIDSCLVQWSFTRHAGWNPIRRWKEYWAARTIFTDMGSVLGGLRNYLENDRLLYGLEIRKSRVPDTLVAETARKERAYPSTAVVYSAVQQLEQFVKGYGGKVVGYPMMNVTEDSGYLLRVALPVDREAAPRDGILFHKLPGRMALFLEADIHGGEWSVRQAVRQMDYYISDHQKTVMAIPFLSLVTDRRAEPDTSKWVTRLDVPFF